MARVVIVGEIYNADLSIGGGPIIPPTQPPLGIWGPPQMPPGIWPSPGHPARPGGPVDPGYSPPWARPGGGPVDPGYSPPWAQAPGQPPLGIWGGGGEHFPTPPIYIPGQPILPDSGDPTKAHIVVYVPGHGAVSFTVDLTTLPEPVPPVEPEPK